MRKKLGTITVDSGCMWVGDPCYILHKIKPPKELGRTWTEFCETMDAKGFEGEHAAQFAHDTGTPGLGVVTSTGWGDGTYNVYGELDDSNRLTSVTIDFSEEDD